MVARTIRQLVRADPHRPRRRLGRAGACGRREECVNWRFNANLNQPHAPRATPTPLRTAQRVSSSRRGTVEPYKVALGCAGFVGTAIVCGAIWVGQSAFGRQSGGVLRPFGSQSCARTPPGPCFTSAFNTPTQHQRQCQRQNATDRRRHVRIFLSAPYKIGSKSEFR